ncbi:ribonuclease HII [Amaricoccus sp.]|uniref:ribonuclease HII n=1 Tax=Amaricoccus sp. TaxID=1872485 RepID=UPI001B690286|nr:ribonuclease HII [Amaricoccus sp.]MBP7002820.1 ribonuclease HII [Amaricoccus sp.]
MPPDFSREREGRGPVCGVDEVGRGPWAGPVVAAAVVLDPDCVPEGIDDSKKLTAARREALYEALLGCARVGVGVASVAEVDRVNVLQASFIAMRRALVALGTTPGTVLVDGKLLPQGLGGEARAVIGGDALCLSIAAASVVAKVVRDRMMVALAQQFPGYGWETNVGYGVRAHAEALARLGVTPHHRRSFAPVHKILCEELTVKPLIQI